MKERQEVRSRVPELERVGFARFQNPFFVRKKTEHGVISK